MSRIQRVGLLSVTAVVLVAAFVLSRPSNDPPRRATATPAITTPIPAHDTPGGATTTTPAPVPVDRGPLLTAAGVRKISASTGDRVRFRVRSTKREELHVHGYDIKRELPPGRTVAVSFQASIAGIFEIELEDSGTQIAQLRVQP